MKARSALLTLIAAGALSLGTAAAMAVPAGASAVAQSSSKAPAAAKGTMALTNGVFGCNYANPPYPQIAEGSSGKYVKEAQCLLLYWGFNPDGIDGSFGPNTKDAVLGFQGWLHVPCGLSVDGIVGPHTWHALTNPGC
jgi:peptidoglycan hydrolase-like protein with peptidoglycan-binding domain